MCPIVPERARRVDHVFVNGCDIAVTDFPCLQNPHYLHFTDALLSFGAVMNENTTNTPCMVTLRFDQATYDFLQALRDQDGVNISAWIRDAVRKKAGLTGEPMTIGARPRKQG